MRRDIHKVDNYLIRLGWIALLGGLFFLAFPPEPSASPPRSWMSWVALPAGALMLPIGYLIRAKERKVLVLWDILDSVSEVRMDELERSTGFRRAFVLEALAVINAQPGAYYVHEVDTDRILDGRLRTELLLVESCASCGAPVNERVSLMAESIPGCSHCGAPILSQNINELRMNALREIRQRSGGARGFSILIFVVLLLVFWPAAVAYGVWKSGVVDGWIARMRAG